MIIFDLDGTLWNTLPATEKAALEVVKANNITNFDLSCVKKGMGLSWEENLTNYYPNYSPRQAAIFLDEVVNQAREYIANNFVDIYNGTQETIKTLSKNYQLGIITNNNDNYVKTFFKITGLEPYFCDYIGTATYGITKQTAIKKMAQNHHNNFNVYVGDIKKDMEAALGAGITFIHAKYGFDPNLESQYSINNIKELPQKILQILED